MLALFNKNIGFALLLAIFLNCLFYPAVLKYQAGMMAGKWLNNRGVTQAVTHIKAHLPVLIFIIGGRDYSRTTSASLYNITARDSLLLFTSLGKVLKMSTADSAGVRILETFPYFHVSQVNGKFINYKTRESVVDTFAITLITHKNQTK